MEEIQHVIAEIEQKVAHMQTVLKDVKVENASFQEEINLLRGKLEQRANEAGEWKQKYEEISHQQSHQETREEDLNSQEKDAQIDALVREIDDCIGRLKEE